MKSNRFFLAAALLLAAPSARAALADTTLSIDSVVVTTLRSPLPVREVPYSVEVIAADRILRSPAASLAELLPRVASVESADLQGLNAGVELRGFSSSAFGTQRYTRLLVDGMPAGTRYAATQLLSNLRAVEVVSSPLSSLYGSGAMGGVVNLITPQSRGRLTGGVTLGYGSWNTFSASGSVGGSLARKVDFDLGVDYQKRADDYRTGSRNLLNTSVYEQQVYGRGTYDTTYHHSTFDKLGATLRVGWNVAENWRLNLHNELYHTSDAPTNGMLWGIYDQIDHRLTRHLHRLDLLGTASRHAIRVSPFVGREASEFADWGEWGNYKRTSDYNTLGFTAQDAVRLDFGQLVIGVDHLAESVSETKALEDGTPQIPNAPDYLNAATGVFAQLSARFGNFSGIAGARYDNTFFRTFRTEQMEVAPSKKNYASLSPNLALQYRPLPTLRLHAGVGRAFLAPDAFRLTADYQDSWGYTYKGNPDLKPETATTWELSARRVSKNEAFSLAATLFLTDHRNLAITDPAQSQNGVYQYINAQRARMQGVELSASFDVGRALRKDFSLRFWGNHQRLFHSSIEAGEVQAERLNVNRTKANFGVDFARRTLSVSLSGRYSSSHKEQNFLAYYPELRPSLVDEAYIRTPDYMTLDASLGWQATDRLTLRAKAANLLDELYMERDGYYMPGRNFSISASVRF